MIMSDTSPYHRMLAILYDCMGSTSSHVEGMAKFHNTPCPDDIIDSIQGNAPRHAKEVPLKLLSLFRSSPGGFADGPGHRLRITEISVDPCREDPERLQGTLISELVVEEGAFRNLYKGSNNHLWTTDMLNVVGTLMGGCTSWIIDEYVGTYHGLPRRYLISLSHIRGSTLAYAVAKTILEPEAAFEGHSTASAFLEIYFHAPAHL